MDLVMLLLLGAVVCFILGAQAQGAWLEHHHDCLPHDPDACREPR